MTYGRQRGRTAKALRALDEGEQLARRRAWGRVQARIDAARRRNRLKVAGAACVAAVAALILALSPIWPDRESSSSARSESVSADAVWEMLSSQPGASPGQGSLQEFVRSLAEEGQ